MNILGLKVSIWLLFSVLIDVGMLYYTIAYDRPQFWAGLWIAMLSWDIWQIYKLNK